jgi:hypothetical protein
MGINEAIKETTRRKLETWRSANMQQNWRARGSNLGLTFICRSQDIAILHNKEFCALQLQLFFIELTIQETTVASRLNFEQRY